MFAIGLVKFGPGDTRICLGAAIFGRAVLVWEWLKMRPEFGPSLRSEARHNRNDSRSGPENSRNVSEPMRSRTLGGLGTGMVDS